MAVRRRTTVIRVFPNEASFLRLGIALAMERNEKWLAKRYVAALENVLIPKISSSLLDFPSRPEPIYTLFCT